MKRFQAACIVWCLVTACLLTSLWAAKLIVLPDSELASIGLGRGNSEIFLVDVNRSLSINLTHSAGDERFPAWSPDGQELVFYSERNQRTDLYRMSLADGAVKRLVASGGPGASPEWSGDGQWIAYAGIHQPNAGLYIIRPDGTAIQRLTNFPVVTIVWSPNSQQIAFVGNCENNCDIYVVMVNSGKVRQLTHNGLIDAYPVWSPDSRQLAFISNRSMSFELYVIDVDCDETRLGGCTTQRLSHNRAADSFPAWSPDGKQIAFSSDRSGHYQIYTVASDCFRDIKGCREEVTQLTHHEGTNIIPLWSPTGTHIAFLAADHSADFDIYVVDVATKALRLLQRKIPHDGTVAWRPR